MRACCFVSAYLKKKQVFFFLITGEYIQVSQSYRFSEMPENVILINGVNNWSKKKKKIRGIRKTATDRVISQAIYFITLLTLLGV